MAFEPYLINRKQNCYRSPTCYTYNPRTPLHDPNCTSDKYKTYFQDRWKSLSQNLCRNRCKPPPKSLCPTLRSDRKKCSGNSPILKEPLEFDDICVPKLYERGVTQNQKTYQWPWSHNWVDDCCKPECPCGPLQDAPEMDYVCKGSFPCPPMEDCTTYKHFYYAKPTPCPPKRYNPEPYCPCNCPLESATSYRLDYELKDPVPTGPAFAQAIKRGMWSLDQFCGDTKSDTETGTQFTRKCAEVPLPIKAPDNLHCGEGRLESSTETCSQHNLKCNDRICYPDWIQNDSWMPPDTTLEQCTTYKHFYKPHKLRPRSGLPPFNESPDAIPFSSMNNMWYTCCDPVVDQRVPVEMRDIDPWPRVVVQPIKYQDNLQTDPCAPFRDETTYKADYFAKKRCAPNKWYGPKRGYTPPVLPFIDNTTNRVSYIAYSNEQRKGAKQNPGNPKGIYWGPYKCPPEVDKCRPPYPPPYGHPLKPYTKQCPCGQFDDRSMYHRDFKFWTPEMVDSVIDDYCRTIDVPKGISLYRASYVDQGGKKAEIMPPPKSKGDRCMNPCDVRDLDSLYRLSFTDLWKS